ncbi:hypothetical protein [Deinococcus hopiensis]|uniref:hypothetical protein n=1 Tax=Deinococcus hopiensis TaxID=309885 RepID=UPI00111C464C|nr:hypothetical protein [Deinococcus hopiensis]
MVVLLRGPKALDLAAVLVAPVELLGSDQIEHRIQRLHFQGLQTVPQHLHWGLVDAHLPTVPGNETGHCHAMQAIVPL